MASPDNSRVPETCLSQPREELGRILARVGRKRKNRKALARPAVSP